MTADDMVAIPRDLAERLAGTAHSYDRHELEAILNPPPELDPDAIEALACMLECSAGPLSSTRAKEMLANGRENGWEMVEATELEALRELAAEWGTPWDNGSGPRASRPQSRARIITDAQADAIRKAKAAGR